ncbi:MAG: UDP-N-acetylmuramate dehydrogenase, partial [Bacteroidaceae bacterium]|nr:UDP-N-acetylmuramate dehydrogenase [Bacteroidaceae bacterium]
MLLQENIDITHRHTFGIPTQARAWGEYESVEELCQLLRTARDMDLEYMPIGQGSNLLFVRDYEGMLLHSSIKTLQVLSPDDNTVLVQAGSGWVWDDFVAYCVDKGWGGLENLSYIPGTVGASAVQNVGAYGVEACDLIASVSVLDTETLHEHTLSASECAYGYRTSRFKTEWCGKYVVTAVTYRLSQTPTFILDYGNLRAVVGDNPTLQRVRDAVIEIRRSKLPEPAEQGSAGSFFINPVISREHYNRLLEHYPDMPCYEVDADNVKVPAGWLIDRQ